MAKFFLSLIVGVLFVSGTTQLQGKTYHNGNACSNEVGVQYRAPIPP